MLKLFAIYELILDFNEPCCLFSPINLSLSINEYIKSKLKKFSFKQKVINNLKKKINF